MPLFGRSKKRKSEPKRRKVFGLSNPDFPGFPNPYPNPKQPSASPLGTRLATWQTPPFSQRQWPAPIPQTQAAPHPYPYVHAHASSPYLPRQSPRPPQPLGHANAQQKKWNSCQNLPDTVAAPCQVVNATVNRTTDYLNRGAALCDQVAGKFNDVISHMDEETFTGNEQDLRLTYYQLPAAAPPLPPPRPQLTAPEPAARRNPSRALVSAGKNVASKSNDRLIKQNVATTANVFEKAGMYANSKLPADLPLFKVYIPTWPIICLAARYSLHAYRKPLGAEKDAYVEADWRVGTKAMVIKSVPVDDMNAVVFAIRGTQTFMDWAVNLNTTTVSAAGFLDDAGNLCHAGFLDVARKMIQPVARRLRQMLEENPNRSSCSLVITGHSAGGAVASLLYSHMLSETTQSELSMLTSCFKRVHCVSFGAPPVSLLPLGKPGGQERRLRKHLFLSFINEGDPVSRADKNYVRSLLELYASPPPKAAVHARPGPSSMWPSTKKAGLTSGLWNYSPHQKMGLAKKRRFGLAAVAKPYSDLTWKVPSAALSNAGRLVVLRIPMEGREEDVQAFATTDERLRGVVYGDPMMHQMKVYFRRIETLATKAATGR